MPDMPGEIPNTGHREMCQHPGCRGMYRVEQDQWGGRWVCWICGREPRSRLSNDELIHLGGFRDRGRPGGRASAS